MTDKRKNATKVKCKRGRERHNIRQYSWNILFFRQRIWVLLELVRSKTQNVTIIDQEKHKIKQIYIWMPMTTGFIMWTITTASIRPSFKFVFPQFTSSSCFILFTGLDELGKVACSQCMGIHSTEALTQRPWVCFPLKSWKFLGGLICNCLDCNYHCDAIYLLLNLYFHNSHHLHVSFLSVV